MIKSEDKRIKKEEEINKRRLGFAVSAVSSKINVKSLMRSCSNCSDSTAEATRRAVQTKKKANARMSFRVDAPKDIGISQL